jgi:hypothetical protein
VAGCLTSVVFDTFVLPLGLDIRRTWEAFTTYPGVRKIVDTFCVKRKRGGGDHAEILYSGKQYSTCISKVFFQGSWHTECSLDDSLSYMAQLGNRM